MWWAIGGIVVVAAILRWFSGRSRSPDRSEMISRAHATLRRGRPVAIALAGEGPVVIRGKVSAAGPPLTAPLTQRPCVFYNVPYLVVSAVPAAAGSLGEGAPSGGEGIVVSSTTERDRRGQAFLVTDDSGTAEVAFDDVEDVSFLVEPVESPQAVSSASDAPQGLSFRAANSEAALFVGDTVTVAGEGKREVPRDSDASGHSQPRTRYVVRAGATMVLMVRREE